MSIALTVTVRPSRYLLVAMSILFGLGLLVAFLAWKADPQQYSPSLRIGLAISCVVMSITAFGQFFYQRKTWTIDIFGNGKIQLREHTSTHTPNPASKRASSEVQLLAQSTLWPLALLLHFSDKSQRTTSIVVLRDSLDPEGFRGLAVVCHWLGERHRKET